MYYNDIALDDAQQPARQNMSRAFWNDYITECAECLKSSYSNIAGCVDNVLNSKIEIDKDYKGEGKIPSSLWITNFTLQSLVECLSSNVTIMTRGSRNDAGCYMDVNGFGGGSLRVSDCTKLRTLYDAYGRNSIMFDGPSKHVTFIDYGKHKLTPEEESHAVRDALKDWWNKVHGAYIELFGSMTKDKWDNVLKTFSRAVNGSDSINLTAEEHQLDYVTGVTIANKQKPVHKCDLMMALRGKTYLQMQTYRHELRHSTNDTAIMVANVQQVVALNFKRLKLLMKNVIIGEKLVFVNLECRQKFVRSLGIIENLPPLTNQLQDKCSKVKERQCLTQNKSYQLAMRACYDVSKSLNFITRELPPRDSFSYLLESNAAALTITNTNAASKEAGNAHIYSSGRQAADINIVDVDAVLPSVSGAQVLTSIDDNPAADVVVADTAADDVVAANSTSIKTNTLPLSANLHEASAAPTDSEVPVADSLQNNDNRTADEASSERDATALLIALPLNATVRQILDIYKSDVSEKKEKKEELIDRQRHQEGYYSMQGSGSSTKRKKKNKNQSGKKDKGAQDTGKSGVIRTFEGTFNSNDNVEEKEHGQTEEVEEKDAGEEEEEVDPPDDDDENDVFLLQATLRRVANDLRQRADEVKRLHSELAQLRLALKS